ncbi:MAG TPA: PQQ-binding-like beta-propeller repeat protein [Polyangiaceae bacterium]
MIRFTAALIALLLASSGKRELDPTRAQRFVLAPHRVVERWSPTPLPKAPRIRWRIRVAGGIVHPPGVMADGTFLVAHALPNVAQYDGAGRLQWTTRLGASAAATSPIALSDGNRLVLTESGEAVCLSAKGAVQWSRALPLGSFERAPILSTGVEGSLLVADGRRLVRLDGGGEVAHVSEYEQDIRAAFGGPGPSLVIGSLGGVAVVGADGRLTTRVDFGGAVDAVVRPSETRLLAVVDGKRLVELDLRSRAHHTRFLDPSLSLGTAFVLNTRREARLIASGDLLLAFGADGSERFRVPLPSTPGSAAQRSSADLTFDDENATLVVRAGADVTGVHADGTVVRVEGTACADPLRPVSLTGRAVLLSCRSGVLVRADDTPP